MTPQSFPFSKNRYFPRKRMRSSDFVREQEYVEHKLAFLSQWDFGAGVALGLEVQRVDGDSLLVSPGFAVDGYGRWLIVDEPAICRIRTLHGFDALHGETALLWLAYHEEYLLHVPFTRESWHGRMKTCRGIGASLGEEEIALWEQEHIRLLSEIAPAEFTVLHYGAAAELKAV